MGARISHGQHPLSFIFYVPVDLFIGHQFLWFVKFYYWLGAGRFILAFRRIKAVITNLISERREKARNHQLQCFRPVGGSQLGRRGRWMMSDDEIISNCLTFLFAAYDTTSLTLTCASHLLATHPHVQDKLCSLLDTYWSQHKDAPVSTVAQEVYTILGHGSRMARVCREATEVCGIPIPKDMNIIVPVHYLHRVESIWGDPHIFRPERFEKEESEGRQAAIYQWD